MQLWCYYRRGGLNSVHSIDTWQVHDALLWDNRCMLHCALGFDDTQYERHMLRTTLEGDLPYFEGGEGVIRSSLTAA